MRRVLAVLGLLAVVAAGPPPRGMSLQVPSNPLLPVPPRPPASAASGSYAPAPTPNRDIDGLPSPRASTATTVEPSLVTRSDTYRGEGFAKGSTATSEQERRVRPGVGFNLRMPLSPN